MDVSLYGFIAISLLALTLFMPLFDVAEKRPRINIFKLSDGYYFKHFFDDPELFRELEPFYEKARYRLKMAAARHMALVEQAARLGGVGGELVC